MSKRGNRVNNLPSVDEDAPTRKSKRGSSQQNNGGSQKANKKTPRGKSAGTPRLSQSQSSNSTGTPRSSSQSQRSIVDFIDLGTSKKNLVPEAKLLELSSGAAFYIISVCSTKMPITRSEIIKNILANYNSKLYPQLIEKTNELLLEIFGMKLHTVDEKLLPQSDKFLVVNSLGSSKTVIEQTDKELEAQQVLLCLLLNCILLSGGRITEENMLDFLVGLQIQPKDTNNKKFGNIPARLAAFKSQLYLKYELDKSLDPPAPVVQWGPRAHAEVSKKEMFAFVRLLYPGYADIASMILSASDDEEEEEESEEESEEEGN